MQGYFVAFAPLLLAVVALAIGLPVGLHFAAQERAERPAQVVEQAQVITSLQPNAIYRASSSGLVVFRSTPLLLSRPLADFQSVDQLDEQPQQPLAMAAHG
jgi:hypothetical protein